MVKGNGVKSAIVGAVIGIVFLTVVNIIMVAYSYGRLEERVEALAYRIERLENIINHADGLSESLEGRYSHGR